MYTVASAPIIHIKYEWQIKYATFIFILLSELMIVQLKMIILYNHRAQQFIAHKDKKL